MMSRFERGLDDDFVCRLNELYRQDSWWKEMVDDRETFVGIRKNYVNVYFRGASLVRLKPSPDGIAASVHYKYLLRPRLHEEYVRIGADGRIAPAELMAIVTDHIDVNAFKAAARNYAGEEKTGVHAIAVKPDNAVVDVEVAISEGGVARRIDIAGLVDEGDDIAVRFFEAKAFSNGELRAEDKPAVVEQISRYQDLVRLHEKEIVDSYRRVCRNLCALEGMALEGRRKALIDAVAAGAKPLSVDIAPRLVVFGFDQDQRGGTVWGKHLSKLKELLDRDPIAVGDAKNVRLDR